MKIVQAMSGSRNGGAENFFMRLIPQLDHKGIFQKILLRPQSERIETLENLGIPCTSIFFKGPLDLKSRLTFFCTIQSFKPDIVLTWMNRATLFCPSSSFFRGILPPFKHVARLGGYYKLNAYKNCDFLIGNTKGIVQYLIDKGWPKERLVYLPNFIEIPEKSLIPVDRALFNTPYDVPLILALGRYHSNKAFDILIKAAAKVKEAYFWIIGEGPLKEELLSLSQALKISSRIRFIPWQKDPGSFYKAADIFVCPSRHEPLGNVILEAWSHGLPVIATASQGALELITNGQGLLVPLDNSISLADTLNRLISHPKEKSILGSKGFTYVKNHFSAENVVEEYLAFFNKILSSFPSFQ